LDQRLIQHYNNELRFIREMGAEFAGHFPKVAGRLGLEGLECADPYVERLLESFAFLAARVQLKMDEEFPGLCQQLLNFVYPDYLAPLPSMAIVAFQPELDDPGLADGFVIKRDEAQRSGLGSKMQTACEFRLCQSVQLLPLKVAEAEYIGTRARMANFGVRPGRNVVSGVRIRLQTTAGVKLNELNLDALPFYISGAGTLGMTLFEQVMGSKCGYSVVTGTGDKARCHDLSPDAVEAMGFREDERVLQYRARSFEGYRLLREFFAFPDRFRFMRFGGLRRCLAGADGDSFDLIVHLDRRHNELENVVDAANFLLFCAPVVNLFPRILDRVRLTDHSVEQHVVPDRSRPMDFEIYQLLEVTGHGSDTADSQEFLPFYSLRDRHDPGEHAAYYTLTRKARVLSSRQRQRGARSNYLGQEVFISLVDGHQAPYSRALSQVGVKALCTNRDLPTQMPLGQRGGDLFLESGAPIKEVKVLQGPTRPSSMGLSGESRERGAATTSGDLAWRLINHLTLNYLSLVDESPQEGASAMRQMLELYVGSNPVAERQINGLISIEATPVTRRLQIPGPISFGRGLKISVTFEEAAFEAGGMYLMGSILNQFFRKYVSLNNVVETVAYSDNGMEIGKWPVMMGRRPEL